MSGIKLAIKARNRLKPVQERAGRRGHLDHLLHSRASCCLNVLPTVESLLWLPMVLNALLPASHQASDFLAFTRSVQSYQHIIHRSQYSEQLDANFIVSS